MRWEGMGRKWKSRFVKGWIQGLEMGREWLGRKRREKSRSGKGIERLVLGWERWGRRGRAAL